MPKTVEIEMDGVNKTVEVKTPRKKKCNITDVLPATIIALVKANPRNDTMRNMMLAHLKVSVPVEADTFEAVQEWIEYNIDKPPRPKSSWELKMERQQAEIARHQEEEARRRANQVMLQVTASEREHGRCSYHQDQGGSGEMPIDRAMIVRLASEADSGSDFFDRVEEILDETGPGNYLSMNVEGTPDYDDFEPDETTDSSVTLQDAGKTALKEALRNADPELFSSLFGE